MGLSTFDIFKNISSEDNPDLKVLTDEELHKLQSSLLEIISAIPLPAEALSALSDTEDLSRGTMMLICSCRARIMRS